MAIHPLTWAIIRVLTAKGRKNLKEIMDNCARANDLSRELLMRIVRDNKDTEYGRRCQLSQQTTFLGLKNLPLRTHYVVETSNRFGNPLCLLISKGWRILRVRRLSSKWYAFG